MNDFLDNTPIRHLIPGILLAGLLLLAYMVLSEFLLSLTWAFILAYVTWPLYRWLRHRLKNKSTLSAGLMTLMITTVIFLTIYWLANLLQEELKNAYQALLVSFSQGSYQLPEAINRIPWLGPYLQEWIDRLSSDWTGVAKDLAGWLRQWLGEFAYFLGNIGRYVVKLAVILVTLFFCFRDGEDAIKQSHQGIVRFLGKHQDVYLQAAGHTTKAVVYGLVLAALVQGMLAGIGYFVAGVRAPVLFGAVTALLALVPMGATLVWVPIGITLLLIDQIWAGIGLLLWGFLVVSTVDNVIRPLVISGAGRVPFLVVMFGVLGGLNAFGAVGLFLGPVILAVLLAVWQAWLEQQREQELLSNHNDVAEKYDSSETHRVSTINVEGEPK
jgi:Ca2+-transporting ATPase